MIARTILQLDASARSEGSVSRDLTRRAVAALSGPETELVVRDLAATAPAFVDEAWIGANFTPDEARTAEQREALARSDALIAELKAADTLVIGVPIYNFTIPASLKAWIDQIARARVTFEYSDKGPKGLLTGKTAYLIIASGGVAVDGEADFATGYLRHVLGFLGIDDVRVIAADKWMFRSEDDKAAIERQVDSLGAAGLAAA
ncbi:MAG: NAD(P)H-dependent oxidoreductase [Pseudomonadota bacterium]